MRRAICPGSFDPITLGHLDIIRRASVLFDAVTVCVMVNGGKGGGMFSAEERLEFVRLAVEGLENVDCVRWDGLLADLVVQQGASALVKGVRGAGDFDWEYQMACINRGLGGAVETVLLPAAPEYVYFSSTMAREMIRYGQDLRKYLPTAVADRLRKGNEDHGE